MTRQAKVLRSIFKRGNSASLIRWLLVAALVWGIPSLILWGGIQLYVNDGIVRQNREVFDQMEHQLDNYLYDLSPGRFFQPQFEHQFIQTKGLPVNPLVLTKIVNDFKKRWPEKLIDVYLFNGDYKLLGTSEDDHAYETFFQSITAGYDQSPITPENLAKLGQILPAPDILLSKTRAQNNKVVKLGNPDYFSYCYFNFDKSVSSRFVAGMMIFIHQKYLEPDLIIKTTIKPADKVNYGYINSIGPSNLPEIISHLEPDSLLNYFQQYPTNSFTLAGHLITLKRLDEYRLLVGAFAQPQKPWLILSLLFLAFVLSSYSFLKMSFKVSVFQKQAKQSIRKRLIGLFAISYALPIIAAAFLSIQYLSELSNSIVTGQQHSNYRRLAEIDSGFDRFITSKLLEFKRFSAKLQQNVTDLDLMKEMLEEKYNSFAADNLHMTSSDSRILFTRDLMTAEVRRHYQAPHETRQRILESWRARNAVLTERHMQAIFSQGDEDGRPEAPKLTPDHNSFMRLLVSTGRSAMEYYNNSNEIRTFLPQSTSDLVLDTLVETGTQSLFQSARTNIGRFTQIQGMSEIFFGYLDVLAGPDGEAWYALAALVDLVNFERQYFEQLYDTLSNRSETLNRIYSEEDIRAVSTHHYAPNFPTAMEFKHFDAIIRRSNTDFKTFSQTMFVDGRESMVSVLRGSYLSHYMLLKITPVDELNQIFHQRLLLILASFTTLFLMGFGLTRLLLNLFILPINDIMLGVQSLANRDYEHRIPVRSKNEFGILARAFNESAEILKQMAISERIRKQLYPEKEFRCGSYLIATANSNSRIILSDFFDYTQLKQGSYAIIIAEVSGNDISAAYLTAMLKTSFTLLCPSFPFGPEAIMTKLNQIFLPYYQKGHLTTCFIGMIDPTNDKMICANAGHSYPISIGIKTGEASFIPLPSTPLGINPDTLFIKQEICLKEKILVFYSDGAISLTDKEGIRIDHDRFLELVAKGMVAESKNPSEQVLQHLLELAETNPWQDDITIMTILNRI